MLNLRQMPEYTFPEPILWGSATAGHQIEGDNIHSSHYHNEQAHPEYYDEPSGKACNSYELYKEDIELLKKLGHQAYRFSIEWCRIQPEEGKIDYEALAHYQDMLDRLAEAGIHSSVTLVHFSVPWWFDKKGGFAKAENLHYFTEYIDFIVPKIADRVGSWTILNEFNLSRSLDPIQLDRKIGCLKAHCAGALAVKQYSNAPVSSAHAFVHQDPVRPLDKLDCTMANLSDWMVNEFFFHAVRTGEIVLPYRDMEYMPELKQSCDYWAINYYHRTPVTARSKTGLGTKLEFARYKLVDCDFGQREFNPESFMQCASRITDKPVWITENGICCDDDRFRIMYTMLQLEAMKMALAYYPELKIKAYMHWSLLDNYEWSSYIPRFGLCDVNRETFERTPKPSAWFLKEVIERNGFSGELFEKYVPELSGFTLYEGVNKAIGITIN
ncbi:MAG: glycoside hydrolase family 1 protein [Lentisphaerae bacterium]|nr:glycoside hydrolase family 1 protein [Lentisphaerota bacterium]